MSRTNDQSDTSPILTPAEDAVDTGGVSTCRITHPWTPALEENHEEDFLVNESDEHVDLTRNSNTSSRGVVVFVIAVINVISNVVMNVSLPVFGGTMVRIGGDPFVVLLISAIFFPVLFFVTIFLMRIFTKSGPRFLPDTGWRILILNGVLTALNGVLIVFASPPDRTPEYLQGILPTATIPFTVLCTPIILRKGISRGRLMCTAFVLVGLFITMEPQLWRLEGSGVSGTTSSTGIGSVIWPLIFALGFLPLGISNVIYEKELKTKESKSFTFVTWTQVFQVFTIFLLFWVDFIPKFGMARSLTDFGSRLKIGFHCCFSLLDTCNGLVGKFWLFIVGYCLANLFQCLLIAYSEGAVYAVVVQSLVTPLAALFWSLFEFDVPDNHFFWHPRFNITTAFTIGGLVVIVPSIILYNYLSREDGRSRKKKRGGRCEEEYHT